MNLAVLYQTFAKNQTYGIQNFLRCKEAAAVPLNMVHGDIKKEYYMVYDI